MLSWFRKILSWLRQWLTDLLEIARELYEKAMATQSHLLRQFIFFLPFLVASSIAGLVAFLYSRLFSFAEGLSAGWMTANRYSVFITTPIFFFISWWLVARYAPYARGSGIPQVMAAVELSKPGTQPLLSRFVSLRVLIVKVLSSTIKMLGGGILGREGPTIQISSAIFHEIGRRLPSWWKPVSAKNMLITGAASGLAAAFNTPLGGIIFAIEELSKFHVRHYRAPLFIAVIIAGLTAQGLGGSYLYLGYPTTSSAGWLVLAGILVSAILAGFGGAQTGVFLLRFMKSIGGRKSRGAQWTLILGCAMAVATMLYFFGADAGGSGKEVMERVLFTDQKEVSWYLPLLKIGGLIATFGFGGAGGVFAPSLSIGAMIGALVSEWFNLGGGQANVLVLVGMTAFLTGITRAPFTAAIIVFEMTDRHSVIFFLMLGSLIAYTIASQIDRRSLYDHLKEGYVRDVTRNQPAARPSMDDQESV